MSRSAVLLSLLLGISSFSAPRFATAAEVDDSVVWIDVRTAAQYRRGHIDGAINIPHGDIGHRILVEVPDTYKEVHVYDGSQGTFAGIVLEMLMEIGFQEVVNEGGYEALLEKKGTSK